jgi:hypothetical protein
MAGNECLNATIVTAIGVSYWVASPPICPMPAVLRLRSGKLAPSKQDWGFNLLHSLAVPGRATCHASRPQRPTLATGILVRSSPLTENILQR